MWRSIKLVTASSAVALSLGLTIASGVAQDSTINDPDVRTNTTRDDNDGFDLGWIGLAGLAGLAGLMPRDRDRTVRTDATIKR